MRGVNLEVIKLDVMNSVSIGKENGENLFMMTGVTKDGKKVRVKVNQKQLREFLDKDFIKLIVGKSNSINS